MKRYYVEFYNGKKFIGNYDTDNLDFILSLQDDYCNKVIVKDTKTLKEYVVKEKK